MNWSFENLNILKDFSIYLSVELDKVDETDLSNELKDWKDTFFTTSSEYLGELRVILCRILKIGCKNLSNDIKTNIRLAISAINNSFKV